MHSEEWEPDEVGAPMPGKVVDMPLANRTEEGVTDYLVAAFGRELRYVTDRGWYTWQTSHWQRDEEELAFGKVRKVTDRLRAQADAMSVSTPEEEKAANAFRGFVARMQTARAHEAVLRMASRDPRLRVERAKFDHQPFLLPCLNGTVDLRTGARSDADPEHLMGRVAPVEYDAAAEAPKFQKFLEDIQPDEEMRKFLQRSLGHTLFGVVREHVFPIWFGEGANGKSVLAGVVQRVLGEYAQTAPRSLVIEMRNEVHDTEKARLGGVRLAVIHETKRGVRLNVEAVKALTGGDPVVANFMHQDKIEFVPSHSLILLSNFKPQMDAAIRAVWRRLLLVPFDVEIPADKQNLSLTEEIIEAESAGVLRWLVDGAVAWWTATQGKKGASGLNPPQRVIDETREYQASEDRVGAFIEARCTLGPGKTAEGGKLFKAFREFCDEELGVKSVGRSNEFFHALSQARGADGVRLGKSVPNTTSRRKEYRGIALGASDRGPVRTAEPAMNDNQYDDDPGFTLDPDEFRD